MYKHRFITDEEILNSSVLMSEVYKPLTDIPELINNLALVKTIAIEDTQLAIFCDTVMNTIYVAFRGTSESGDVVTDISYYPKKWLDTKSHAGFIKAFDSISYAVFKEVNDITYSTTQTRLIFCGHSLGGAIAHLAFYFANYRPEVLKMNVSNVFCVTEGCPKVFVERKLTPTHQAFSSRAVRVTYADDVVPTLPPRTLILTLTRGEYTHVGQHWSIGIQDYKEGFTEHSSKMYLKMIQKEVSNA